MIPRNIVLHILSKYDIHLNEDIYVNDHVLNGILDHFHILDGDTNYDKIVSKIKSHYQNKRYFDNLCDYFCYTSTKFILNNNFEIDEFEFKPAYMAEYPPSLWILKLCGDKLCKTYDTSFIKTLYMFKQYYCRLIKYIDMSLCLRSFYVNQNSKYPNDITDIICKYIFQHVFDIKGYCKHDNC